MASAYLFRNTWYLSFRAPGQRGTKRTRKRAPDECQTKPRADRLAKEIDRACRVAEDPSRAHDLALPLAAAIEILRPFGLAAEAVDDTAKVGKVEAPSDPREVSITYAALIHPTAVHEREHNPKDKRRHEKELEQFIAWAKTDRLADLTLELVQRYVAYMRNECELSPDTRRHRLMYVRNAARMAPQFGLLDRLTGLRLDSRRQEAPRDVRTFAVAQLRAMLSPGALPDRDRAAAALMAFAGLRPSEACRLRVRDLRGDLLYIGGDEEHPWRTKNNPSRRVIPIAATLVEILAPLIEDREPDEPILPSAVGTRMDSTLLHQNLGQKLKDVIGDRTLTNAHFRKTFRTLATEEWGLDHHRVEMYIGHQAPGVPSVSWTSYLAKEASRLRPVAKAADKALRKMLAAVGIRETAPQVDPSANLNKVA